MTRTHSLDRSTSSRGARFREGLRSPITAYLALVNGFVLGFLLFLLLGPAGIALTVAIVVVSTLAIAFLAGGAIAGRDFIESYAELRGYKANPRYRLPHRTPSLRVGAPKEGEGVGYAQREFEGDLVLRSGAKAPFMHSSTTLRYRPMNSGAFALETAPARKISAWLVRLPDSSRAGTVVIDGLSGPSTRFEIGELPRMRRIFPGVQTGQTSITKGTSKRLATEIARALVDREEIPRTISIQLEDESLLVWSLGWHESREEMDEAMRIVTSIASAVDEVGRLGFDAEPADLPPPPVDDAPVPWRRTAAKHGLEYWPTAIIGRREPLGDAACRGAIAGVIDGLEVVVARFDAVVLNEWNGQPRTVRYLATRVFVDGSADLIPSIECVDRSVTLRTVLQTGLIAIQEPMELVDPLIKRISNARNREKLESTGFNTRFEVRAKEGSDTLIRRLFSPSFILWCAEQPIDNLGWGWDGRVAYAYVEAPDPSAELVTQICDAGVTIASRIATEAEELRS